MTAAIPHRRALLLFLAVAFTGALAVLAVLTLGPSPQPATASSHREAPLISLDPTADNTDVYAFVSPDKPDTVTIVANYIPLEEPAGGPNFASFDDTVRYEINIDNDGDADEDITYRFRFSTEVLNKDTFLYNTGQITSLDDPDFNVRQTYSVTRFQQGRGRDELGSGLATPPVNIGPRSTPAYEALAAEAVHELADDVKVFAGQRDDPFFVDLGSVFDLLGLRPFNPFHLIPLPAEPGVDGVGGYNTHSIVIQVPIEQVVKIPNETIGIYASAKRPQMTTLTLNENKASGPLVQVSRLGNPLINEVIIPLGKKDRWNRSDPEGDTRFVEEYTKPEVPALVNLLYPALPDAPTTNRDDLVAVLLTGVPGLNFTGPAPADLLRLNTSIAPTAAVGEGNRLGVLEGDLAGFPNGRRLEDDVTDIEVRALACGYGDFLEGLLGLCNLSPNNVLGDGVDVNDVEFLDEFPYVGTPHQGYDHEHHRIGP